MNVNGVGNRKSLKTESRAKSSGRNLRGYASSGAQNIPVKQGSYQQETSDLLSRILSRENMLAALKRVESNKGAAGIDQMDVRSLRPFLKDRWPEVREEILEGNYFPRAVRRVWIPKPGSKEKRELGIPTVLDRLIQQAIHQVLSPEFEPYFSNRSFGFRVGRGAHDALKCARGIVRSGYRHVVDLDLEKFFDLVNHDILMSKIHRKIKDVKLLRLIRRYLRSGIMLEGVKIPSEQGTPQGGPLSPLLSNILLDDLDKELEKRGHQFIRYADDVSIFVKSKRAGERVLASIECFLLTRLGLKLNKKKSKVGRPWSCEFLGFSMTTNKRAKLKPSRKSLKRFKGKVKKLVRQGKGRKLASFITYNLNPFLRGWINYFRLSDVRKVFHELDEWIRHRLRCIVWRQWKRPMTRFKRLLRCGLSEKQAGLSAFNGRGPWWNSKGAHMNFALPFKLFAKLGLVILLERVRNFNTLNEPPWYGTVCPVV